MVKSEVSSGKSTVVEVTINQQQYVVIEKLRAGGQFGTTDGEILRRVFQEFVQQEGY